MITEDSNPEEFWALRGAGWGLGVITRFLIKLHPLKSFNGKLLLFVELPCLVMIVFVPQSVLSIYSSFFLS